MHIASLFIQVTENMDLHGRTVLDNSIYAKFLVNLFSNLEAFKRR